MRKTFGIVIIFLILYIVFQMVYNYIVGSRTTTYSISADNYEYQIKEVYNTKNEADSSNYYYEITTSDNVQLSFKIVGNYSGVKRFLQDLKVYKENNLTCIYPIFRDKTNDIDVLCNKDNKQYLYSVLKGQNSKLDNFVNSLTTLGYSHPSWTDANMETKKVGKFDVYPNNISADIHFTVWQYKGFYLVTKNEEHYFSLGTVDQYDPNITAVVGQYYIVPNYKVKYAFAGFYITNLISGNMATYNLNQKLSTNSFIQGVVDNTIYLVDKDEKIQYAIDVLNKTIKLTGDTSHNTKFYVNGKWEEKSIYDVVDNNLMFENNGVIPDELKAYNPTYAYSVGGKTAGYYYLFVNESNGINVYRVDKLNTKTLTLICQLSNISNIKFINDGMYFISGDTLYMYRSSLGLKPLAKYSEFIFNKSNMYNIYIDE